MTSTATEVTQVQSLAAIRNFIRVAVSCVTYLRGLCNDESYQPRQFLGLQLKQLVRSSPEADVISQWMEDGAFDALNKGYLKALSLCVYTPNCTELLESYSFALSYTPNGKRAALTFAGNSLNDAALRPCTAATSTTTRSRGKRHTRQEVQQALAGIITKLVEVVEGLPPLLCERVLVMQLTYYEDVTPPTYEPPCFAPASADLTSLHQQEQRQSTNIASLDTGHHMMSITIRHRFFDRLLSQSSMIAGNSTLTASTWNTTFSGIGTEGEEDEDEAAAALKHIPDTNAACTQTCPVKESSQRCPAEPAAISSTFSNDLAFFVFTCFILTRSPVVYRGRVSTGEIAEYLRVSCPLEITLEMAHQMMHRLELKGVVAATAQQEWIVHPLPAAALAGLLLAQREVVPLLSIQIHEDLERLVKGDATTRMSVAAGRKRQRANA
ncbi:HORMA domain containing protein [Trypanosoma rangeli]|uniref:HORMA domain containing protein n=1 Tax=Trypanosoma rangeli TaxID=5698 RepID=A0A3R7MNU5_TRYRA|nr:HORMA domain containing protein [Trypanosoma rangeli]RNF08907.1 HORMA domain containing protein [Trypanosoma rangeli]|eukprot:RNF08907.1 HORMA domain containing protein [Trypanosoma rangeli]